MAMDLDYQGILYAGFLLWMHAFMLKDNTIGALVAYGFALNTSLDASLFWMYIMYRVCCKLLKQLYKERGIYVKHGEQAESLYQENHLDI